MNLQEFVANINEDIFAIMSIMPVIVILYFAAHAMMRKVK